MPIGVVYAGAKIRNFLQFTTPSSPRRNCCSLFMPVQRYEIFCNSQHLAVIDAVDAVVYAGAKIRNFLQFTTAQGIGTAVSGCLCRCKDTKFFAIHNQLCNILKMSKVVYAGAKIRNFLQFTTLGALSR